MAEDIEESLLKGSNELEQLDTSQEQHGSDFIEEIGNSDDFIEEIGNSDENLKQGYHPKMVEIRDLKPGDHIAVKHTRLGISYYHHGIFIGFKEGVVDIGKSSDINVRKIDLGSFMSKNDLLRIDHPPGTCHDPKTTVDMANDMLAHPEKWEEYRLFKNNCEHFAMYCKTGKKESQQVTDLINDLKTSCIETSKRVMRNSSNSSFKF